MFENLIQRADALMDKLEKIKRAYDLGELDSSKSISVLELQGWFDAASAVVSESFGEGSAQADKWRQKNEFLRSLDARDRDAGKFHPISAHIENIDSLKGLLTEFEDIWRARHSGGSVSNQAPTDAGSKLPPSQPSTSQPSGNGRTQIVLAVITAITAILVAYWQYGRGAAKPDRPVTPGQFIGKVRDAETGAKIKGAKVTLEPQDVPIVKYTDSEGVFFFPLSGTSRNIHILVEARGYSLYDLRVKVGASDEIEDIRLLREPAKPENVPEKSNIPDLVKAQAKPLIISKPVPTRPAIQSCGENINCDGVVVACQTSGDRPTEVPRGKWLYGPNSKEFKANLQGVGFTDYIEYGAWTNSECHLSGSGWHAKVGTCETGQGTGWQRCINVKVIPSR